MPRKPKRPCSHPGCPKLTEGRFCEEHQALENKRYEKYIRDPESKKRYGRAWKRIRDRHIAQHPLCEVCKRNGRLTPAEEVHHILPLSQGGTHDDSTALNMDIDVFHIALEKLQNEEYVKDVAFFASDNNRFYTVDISKMKLTKTGIEV